MIQINGPPLAFWPVTRYVLSWLKKGMHAATDKRTGKPSLAGNPAIVHVCFCELVALHSLVHDVHKLTISMLFCDEGLQLQCHCFYCVLSFLYIPNS